MAKKFMNLLAATIAIGGATLFAQESGTAKTGEGRGSKCGLRSAEWGQQKGSVPEFWHVLNRETPSRRIGVRCGKQPMIRPA